MELEVEEAVVGWDMVRWREVGWGRMMLGGRRAGGRLVAVGGLVWFSEGSKCYGLLRIEGGRA